MNGYLDESLDDIYNNAQCGYFSSLIDGTIVRINDTLLKNLDYKRIEIINKKRFQDLLSIGGKLFYETHYAPLLQFQKQIKEINFEIIDSTGKRIPVLINTISVENEKGEVVLNRSTVFDITQRKQYEKELLTAKKNAEGLVKKLDSANKELDKFASTVSHDIKSPLNNIISLIRLLDSEFSSQLGEKGAKYINMISNSAKNLSSLVNSMLGYYKTNKSFDLSYETIDLDLLLKNIISVVDSRNQVKFNFIGEFKQIVTMKSALEQTFLNLFVNAIKYNNKEVVMIEINYSSNEDFYVFDIKDNGIGIEKENLEEIFYPFNTLGLKDRFDEKGTGMGLSSIKKIIEKLGGTISLSSEINKGSTFSFTLKKQSLV